MHNILQKYPTIISAACFFFASNVFAQTPPTAPTPPSINAAALYQQHCASCHGEQRTGDDAVADGGHVQVAEAAVGLADGDLGKVRWVVGPVGQLLGEGGQVPAAVLLEAPHARSGNAVVEVVGQDIEPRLAETRLRECLATRGKRALSGRDGASFSLRRPHDRFPDLVIEPSTVASARHSCGGTSGC